MSDVFPPAVIYLVQNRGEWPLYAYESEGQAATLVDTMISEGQRPECVKVQIVILAHMTPVPPTAARLNEEPV